MKTSKLILVTLVSLTSSLALAAQFTVKTEAEREHANLTAEANYPLIKYQGSKTRAEVHAELEAARSAPPAMPGHRAPAPVVAPKVLEPSGHPAPDLYRGA